MASINADSLTSRADWLPTVSGEAQLSLLTAATARGPTLRMDFDFKGGGGFVVARLALSRVMSKDFAIEFLLRGHGPPNDLEFKLIDAGGKNVWRHVQKRLEPPRRWRRVRIESRDIEFAWGPDSGSSLALLGAIEIAVVAGAGGKGSMSIADLRIEDTPPAPDPVQSASPPDDKRGWLLIDCLVARSLGGLIIDWPAGAPTSGFRVRVSSTGRSFRTVHSAKRSGGKRSYVYTPDLTARFVRLDFKEPYRGATVHLQSFEFSRSIDAFWYSIAAAEARGWHPRWLHREQSIWTATGTDSGTQCALMNHDGMVEVTNGSLSLEPMLWIDGRLIAWSDVDSRQELLNDWMPVPSVIWQSADWRLRVRAEAAAGGELRVHYEFERLGGAPMHARLFVLLRPFQVTPPWQHFRKVGGVSPIHDLAWRDGAVLVNERLRIMPMPGAAPPKFGAMCFDEGVVAAGLVAGTVPAATQVHDAFGFASGVLAFELPAEAQGSIDNVLTCLTDAASNGNVCAPFDWAPRIAATQWAANGWAAEAIAAALTATTHILVTRCGPALQPGPRRYTRSWIRDGAMMSAALLRMGHAREVREFIEWYAPNQRTDGFVPCCVDAEGVDWLVEHDSHGQLIALIADYHRFTADTAFIAKSWLYIERAVACIEGLIDERGLLPKSVSHEGYLAQPVHSYWDDFWALRGLRDAAYLAEVRGDEGTSKRYGEFAGRLAASLFASIEQTRAERQLDFIPGSIEWADFDPTATANAIYLLDVPPGLNRAALERTFERYLTDWRNKRNGKVVASNYTPYEIRIIGALVRMERREAALELLKFFLSDRRPPPWNQWPEIAWSDHAAPAHVGDLPHTWISAEYVLAVRSLFAYEREEDRALILAGGLAAEWLDGRGVTVNAMPTSFGRLTYSLVARDADTACCTIGAGITGKIVLRPPLSAPIRSVTVNGAAVSSFDGKSVTISTTPAEVVYSSAGS